METASTSGGNVEELSYEKRQIYYNLRRIFPVTNPQYIKEILINTPQEVRKNETTEQMTIDLVEHLLSTGDQHLDFRRIGKSQNYWEVQEATSPQEQYNRLIGIFPDADPEYLRKFAMKYYDNAKTMNTFIEEHLEEKTYPSREEYVARKKLEKEYRKYFTEFDVEKFLVEFPDPIKYFEGKHRKCAEDEIVYDLLCQQFQNLQVTVVLNEYKNCKFNASLTSKKLEERNGVKKSFSSGTLKKHDKYMPEFAFIHNRQSIEQHLKKIEKEETEALQKSKDALIHCSCCFNDFIAAKCSTCAYGHIFCNDCISLGTEWNISEGKYTIQCFETCSSVFNLRTLEKVLKPKMYEILVKKQQEEELKAANIENLEKCPFCDFKSVINEGDKVFTCMHEDCKKESCRRCKRVNHLPFECADVFEAENVRIYLEEKMTKALVRTCYKCRKEFIKEKGCNRMNCGCGGVMCYICDQPVSPDNYKHFNGQGSDRFDLCPLYSDDDRQAAEAVIEVAKATKLELQRRNPEINLEIINPLLPILPPKTSGPHDLIPNSDQIPEHVVRVSKAIPP